MIMFHVNLPGCIESELTKDVRFQTINTPLKTTMKTQSHGAFASQEFPSTLASVKFGKIKQTTMVI